jgi:hypothetical protein
MIFLYFSPKIGEKFGVFISNYAEKTILILAVEKNAIFSAENCRKSQKTVIITSTPGTFL